MPVVIKACNLSKSFMIRHENPERLTTFRDVITEKAKTIFSFSAAQRPKAASTAEEFWAIKDVSFTVEQGERVGIIGRNGAGKSTLLKILSRITEPSAGSIRIKGRVASLLEVGTGFHPELSGRENIFLNGAILGMSRQEIRKKLDEIIAFAEVEKFLDTPVKRYSSGMYVRLAFAVAAHLEPEILIVDEVLAVGDAQFQKKCLGKMEDVSNREGRTVLFVSHNMAAIQNLCSSGLVMQNGSAIFSGAVDEAVNKYLLTQEIAVNIEDLSVKRKGNGVVRVFKVEVCDKNDQVVDQVFSGQDIKIKLHYRQNSPDTIGNIIPGIALTSQLDVPVTLHHSRLNNIAFKNDVDTGIFVLTIKNLCLVPAMYNLTYSLLADGTFLDGITNVFQLQVIDGNYYGSGEVPPSSHALCLLDANWSQQLLQN